ncbi:MAG: hypothetical protein Q8N37_02530 [bacterium]|nr:hypothetical protein [bacterium]
MSNNQKFACLMVFILLLAGNIYFAIKYFSQQKELNQAKSSLEAVQSNKKYLDFNKMFIDKILKANGTVDIETRLELENAVRNLGDAEILAQWKKFIDSPGEKDSQEAVKNLLGMLAEKSAF